MQGARGHVEGGGHQDQLGPQVPHDPEKLGKADIKADGQPQFSQRCVHHRDLAAGGEGVRLHKPAGPPAHQCQRGEPCGGGPAPPPGERRDNRCCKWPPPRSPVPTLPPGKSPAPGHAGKKLPGLSSGGLPVDRKAGILIGTVEHLRQQGQIGALGGRPDGGSSPPGGGSPVCPVSHASGTIPIGFPSAGSFPSPGPRRGPAGNHGGSSMTVPYFLPGRKVKQAGSPSLSIASQGVFLYNKRDFLPNCLGKMERNSFL